VSWSSRIIVGISTIFIAFLLFMPGQESNRLSGKDEKRHSGDRIGSKTLVSRIYSKRIEKTPDYGGKVSGVAAPRAMESSSQFLSDLSIKNIRIDTRGSPKEIYYSLHIGSFKDLANAKERVELLAKKGEYAWWRKVNITGKGEWLRVYIGKMKSRAEAVNFGKKLKKDGVITSFIVHKLKEQYRSKN